jgi:hypothetical protein
MSTSVSAATPKTAREISATLWLIAFFGMAALVVGINLLAAWRMDVFGILRDAHGRSLITSDHERKEKYLLNQAYVPENFNALLIGASASVNWHMEPVDGYRFYNESLEGGDATEERKLVEQALQTGHFGAAVVVLYPRLTQLHLLQDGFDQVKRSEALGSLSLLGVEYDVLHERLMHVPATSYPDGSHAVPVHAPPRPTDKFEVWSHDFGSDAQALKDYRALVQELADKGVRIVYVTYPMYEPGYEPNKDAYDRYITAMRKDLSPGPLIDFNAPEYFDFRNDANNYIDLVHLSASGAEKFIGILKTQVEKSLSGE